MIFKSRKIEIVLSRDSVCAGDDIDVPHDKIIRFGSEKYVSKLIESIKSSDYLPLIAEGKATWIVNNSDEIIAVIAQQWNTSKLFIDKKILVKDLIKTGKRIHLFFKYRSQEDPGLICENLSKREK